MPAAPSPLTKIDGFYYAPDGSTLNFALSSTHGYLTVWSVLYGSTQPALDPPSPTASPKFSITVAPGPGGQGSAQVLLINFNPLAGGPGQEDVATLSLELPTGNTVVHSFQTTSGSSFALSISAT